jgi:hypothetical protein
VEEDRFKKSWFQSTVGRGDQGWALHWSDSRQPRSERFRHSQD